MHCDCRYSSSYNVRTVCFDAVCLSSHPVLQWLPYRHICTHNFCLLQTCNAAHLSWFACKLSPSSMTVKLRRCIHSKPTWDSAKQPMRSSAISAAERELTVNTWVTSSGVGWAMTAQQLTHAAHRAEFIAAFANHCSCVSDWQHDNQEWTSAWQGQLPCRYASNMCFQHAVVSSLT